MARERRAGAASPGADRGGAGETDSGRTDADSSNQDDTDQPADVNNASSEHGRPNVGARRQKAETLRGYVEKQSQAE